MLQTLARQSARAASPTWSPGVRQYKAKHPWPPDFSKLSEKHQFRLERRYKRRAKLKWARPRLMMTTKILQWTGGIGVLVYGVLFMNWEDKTAFHGIRSWYRETVDSMWSPRTQLPKTRSTDS